MARGLSWVVWIIVGLLKVSGYVGIIAGLWDLGDIMRLDY
jgi:hypothetical protein